MIMTMFSACGGDGKTDVTTGQTTTATLDTPQIAEMRDITALELVKEIEIGWNLGNTLDATGSSTVSSETSWTGPKTTKEMITKVREAGFNAIRIPTTWYNHIVDDEKYTIDTEWLDRVQEIVNYAIENDMYVILNTHHEKWIFPTEENYEAIKTKLMAIWKQVAERFSGYDEHLIFEAMNEPRKIGTSVEWTGGDEESREVVNKLNADFISLVRGTGGNNAKRVLMITGYAASSSEAAMQAVRIPDDNKIIVDVHAYVPYSFALKDGGASTWRESTAWKGIQSVIDDITETFVSKGIAVVIGEMGARNRDNNTEARVAFAKTYICIAKEAGIPCFWWDNNAFVGSGECFGLLDRHTCDWRFPEIVEALMQGLTISSDTFKQESDDKDTDITTVA